jgi:hypothetical protein
LPGRKTSRRRDGAGAAGSSPEGAAGFVSTMTLVMVVLASTMQVS